MAAASQTSQGTSFCCKHTVFLRPARQPGRRSIALSCFKVIYPTSPEQETSLLLCRAAAALQTLVGLHDFKVQDTISPSGLYRSL